MHEDYNKNNKNNQDLSLQEKLKKLGRKTEAGKRTLEYLRAKVSPQRWEEISQCGNLLTFLQDESREKSKLETGYFCKHRFCPGCAWRKARREAACIATILRAVSDDGYTPIFVTLTSVNCAAEDLESEIDRYRKAYNRLLALKRYKVLVGGIRKLEVTYNSQSETYHPHLHLIWVVSSGYWKNGYIRAAQLRRDWQKVYGDNRISQVNMQAITNTEDSALEMGKYAAKSADYNDSQSVFDTFYDALSGKRLITYTGLCRKLRQAYKLGGLQAYQEVDATKYIYRLLFAWSAGKYELTETQLLDQPLDFKYSWEVDSYED